MMLARFVVTAFFGFALCVFAGVSTAQMPTDDALTVLPDPGLNNPRLRFHLGSVSDHHPAISPLLPDIPGSPSPWYVTQWSKDELLLPNRMTQDAGPTDPILGRPLYSFDTPHDVSHLRIYREPGAANYVYELFSRDGGLSRAGGTNLFLSADADPSQSFDDDIKLSLRTKISAATIIYDTPLAQLAPVVAQYFAGFTISFTDPVTKAETPVFMQIDIANSSGHRSTYRGCGSGSQIIYAKSLDGDPWLPLNSSAGPLPLLTFDLNRYLCDLLTQLFLCGDGGDAPRPFRFPAAAHNLANWHLSSMYIGLETSNHFTLSRSTNTTPQGLAALGVQLTDLRVRRYPGQVHQGRRSCGSSPQR